MRFKIYILLFFVFGFSSMYSQGARSIDPKISNSPVRSGKSISIYPNPVKEYFKIDAGVDIDKIEIYNMIGKRVKILSNNSSGLFDVSDLRNGIYLVRIFGNGGKVLKVLRLGISNDSP